MQEQVVRVTVCKTIDTQPAASTTVCKDGSDLNVAASGGVGSLTYQCSATSLAGPYSGGTGVQRRVKSSHLPKELYIIKW